MGDSIEQWRAKIGQWSGGKPRNCSTLQHQIAQTCDHIGYMQIRFLVLVSLLIIGCVELNPGPNNGISGSNPSAGAVPKFRRRPGSVGLHGELYGPKTAAFLFARGLNRTEEFQLASNVDGVGNLDDLVFRYRLRKPDVWKTCFIQLNHKRNGGTIQRSSLKQLSGKYSLLHYFKSYCEIKNNAATQPALKQCGPFVDFEFVIYTNGMIQSNSPLQGGGPDPLSILSSGIENGKYITFDETRDKDIFEFFEDLSKHNKLIGELDSLLKSRISVDKEINQKIKGLHNSVQNAEILEKLDSLKSTVNTDYVTKWTDVVAKCDFKLFKEFLSKVKIFQNQSNEGSFESLIEIEIQEACKASPSVANFIYTKFEADIIKWWKKDGNVVWLNKNADLWQTVQREIENEIREISKPETQEIEGCDTHFNQQNIEKLSDAIKKNTVLNIVTKSNISTLQKLKTYQALNILGYKNSLFIGIKSLMNTRKGIKQLWPCKWSDVIVVDCDTECNVTHTVLDILQQSADCKQGLNSSDNITAEILVYFLQKYHQKLILISTQQCTSGFQEKLRNVSYFEENFNISDFDENSQKKILERPINFQGIIVPLSTMVGTDPPEIIKTLLDSDAISILLSNEHELSIGRQLGELTKYYVPRVLQHHVYLKEDILKQADKAITFAVSGLHADELKKYLPVGEKICEFVYDERDGIHTFKTVSGYSKSGLSAECGTIKTRQKVGQNMESDEVRFNIIGNKDKEIEFNEGSNINFFSMVDTFSKSGVGAELENTKPYNNARQKIKPDEERYIIFGNKNPDSEFNELKALYSNVHWIHVAERSFLWRDSNCNIDIIRKNIDNTKYEKYDMNCVVEHSDRTILLVDEPGMGKSTFLSYMAHEIKKLDPSVWVLKINLNEYTNQLEDTDFKQECIEKCKEFLWRAAHSTEQNALKITKEIFLQALGQAGKMVIILDGFDEISPDYSDKVKVLITAITDETASKIWISSRFYCRQELEDILGKFAFTLQPFIKENQIQFLEQYWSEFIGISNREDLQTFAENLLCLCSKNISDKDGEFTGIPLQTMMLGKVFVNKAKEYCCSGKISLPERFDLLSLFKKFTKKKFKIYFREKIKSDRSKPGVKSDLKDYEQKHMIAALLYLFSKKEFEDVCGTINSSNLVEKDTFLREGKAQMFGIITGNIDGKPRFIHRCFAEYFAAKWFVDNFRECEKSISSILFNTTNEVIRNIFDRMLAEDYEIHGLVLNGDIQALKQILKQETNINTSDKGGRTALHLAASYNNPYIKELLSIPGIDVNTPDSVLKWTPLNYADRTKSWMAMDILLRNGANPNNIVFTRHNAKDQEWGQEALWECASKGHITLLEFMLDCGIKVNESVRVQENFNENFTLLHMASYCDQVEVVRLIVNRGADINIRSANNNTALHSAAASGGVNVINLLLDEGMSVNMTDNDESTPLHVSAVFGHMEAAKSLVKRGAAVNNTNKYGNTPLINAAYSGKSEIFSYLIEIGADINIRGEENCTALHFASASDNFRIIKLLLDKGMSVNLTDTFEFTPLHISAQYGHLDATKFLVERGAAINCTNKASNTPLMMAAIDGKIEIVRYLTEIGADINIPNDKDTVLHNVASLGSVEIIKLLLDKGMSVNLANIAGFTPLHISAQFGHMEATKTLVERGADINNTMKTGQTPLLMSGYMGNFEIFRYFTESGGDINICDTKNNTALHLALFSGCVDVIKLLLDKGMSVNLANIDGFTPLHASAQFGHLDATKILVEKGAAINCTNKAGYTPLMTAAIHVKLEIVCYLTEIGADINIRNAHNNTALHFASASGCVDIINVLLDKGMSVNVANIDGNTPLHISAQFGHMQATKTLVERGADINIPNKTGQTPLLVAGYNKKLEIFQYLTESGGDINIRDIKNNTAVHLALVSECVDINTLLLDK